MLLSGVGADVSLLDFPSQCTNKRKTGEQVTDGNKPISVEQVRAVVVKARIAGSRLALRSSFARARNLLQRVNKKPEY